MKFSAQLDVNVVAHETADEVVVLLDLEAPDLVDRRRPGAGHVPGGARPQRVDARPAARRPSRRSRRSSSRLDARDNFGVVVFDDDRRDRRPGRAGASTRTVIVAPAAPDPASVA